MGLYRTVSVSFWTDPKMLDDFTPEDKYFYLYLFTNPHTNLAGCYELSFKQATVETGYSAETIERLIERFEQVHRVIAYCRDTKEILLLNWHKHNWTGSAKYRTALLRQINAVKYSNFKDYLISLYEGNEEERYGMDTVSIGYLYPMDTTNTITNTITNTNTNTNKTIKAKQKKVKPAKNIIPPIRGMVEAYIEENGYGVDVDSFMNFYESKGWLVGKSKMKDWQAAVRSWHQRDKKGSTKNPFLDMLEKGEY